MPSRFAAIALALLIAAPAAAQQKLLTLDDLYDPAKQVEFSGSPPTGLAWIDNDHYLWPKTDDRSGGTTWLKVHAASGRSEPSIDVAKAEAAFAGLAGVTRDDARQQLTRRSLVWNPAHSALVLTIADDLYYYDLAADRAVRLTAAPGDEEEASFSPDGRLVAFVRGHDLFVVDVNGASERRLTSDGSPERLNGKLDWIYQEEIYGRGNFRGYWWSPDSARLAFLQLDERPVPEFTVVDHIPYRGVVETTDYPKAGDPNPTVRLGVVRAAGGAMTWSDLDKYGGGELLIVNVSWTPDARRVIYAVQDREQTWLDLNAADAARGDARTVLRETTKAWVNENGPPHWLGDGTFLWFSERSGWKHLYHYKEDGTLLRQVTSGEWEARTLHGVDEKTRWIYFSGTERSHIGGDVYRIRIDGGGRQRLSAEPGTHTANFNPGLTRYLDSWSDVNTPTQVRLHRADGTRERVVHEGNVPAVAQYRLAKPEFVQVKTRDGFVMEALIIKPPDFDPSRRYPVYQHTYGGPHLQQVRNAWGGTPYMYHQMLAQKGLIVWICDNRTASGKGAQSTWPIYRNAGELELRDIEDGLAWLKAQRYVDPARIGIYGWSYGGYMVSYALTHSQSFAMGIAGGSVTDWRAYDSIYTERYMLMPQNNPDGYRRSAPRFAAKDLHGRLLLLHGTIDDNVHMQNTIQFAYELQKAGKPFELMVYPKSRHAVSDPELIAHMRATMLAFIEKTLLVSPAGASTAQR